MCAAAREAEVTISTGTIDLPDHGFTAEDMSQADDFPNELMTRHSFETHIPFDDFKVGIANCRILNFNEDFIGSRHWKRDVS